MSQPLTILTSLLARWARRRPLTQSSLHGCIQVMLTTFKSCQPSIAVAEVRQVADRGNPVLQGTMGLEILRHCPAHLRRDLHAIFVPIGGGGEFLLQHCALSVLQLYIHLSLHPQRYTMLI